jgi:hypothetical protein
MLGERAKMARLADAGDHIDFIVTLVATPAETVGRLERQTQTGTVAIRELRDANCQHVADALALSLGLSLEPGRQAPPAETSLPKTEPESVVAPAPATAEAAHGDTAPLLPPATLAPRPTSTTQDAGATTRHRPRWSAGAHGGVLIGVSPSPMGIAAAFVDLDGALPDLVPALSFRLGVVGAFGSAETALGPVNRSILGGLFEACPFRAGGASWAVRPCLAMEIGTTGASSTRQTSVQGSSLWTAFGAKLRGTLELFQPVALEAEVAALVPVPRTEVEAGSEALYRDSAVVFEGGLGLSVRVQ